MATLNELLGEVSAVDKTLVISNDFRTINIPSSVPNLGVEYDDDVLRLEFKMPRYVSDTDLSAFAIRINYLNSKGESDVYTVSDKLVGSDYITFSWLVGPTATRYKGNTKFIVCAKTILADGTIDKEFNTTIATLPVLEGLEVDEAIVTGYSDIIEQWRQELFGIGDTEEASIKAVSEAEQAAIENKGAEVLATIPLDYRAAVSMTDNADRTKADAIVCYEQGEQISIHDSSDDYLRGLKIFGKSTQVNTTGKNLVNFTAKSMTISGVTFTVYDNGEILVSGSPTQDVYYDVGTVTYTGGVEYAITGCPAGGSMEVYSLYAYHDDGQYSFDTGSGNTYTPETDQTNSIRILIKTGTTVSNLLYRPMVRLSSVSDDSYEPYSGYVASPSPAWPQEVIATTNPKVKITGNNLLGGTALADAIYNASKATTSTIDESAGTVSFTGGGINGATIYSGPFRPNTQYTLLIYGQNTTGAIPYTNVSYLYEDGTIGPTQTKFDVKGEDSYVTITSEPGKTVRSIIGKWMTGTVVLYYDKSGLFEGVKTAADFKTYNEQSASFDYSLLGVPVSQNGNCIDSNGQQWICDEIDLRRGMYIKRIGNKVFDGSTDEIWHDELVLDNTVMFRIQINDSVNVGNIVGKDYLCSNFPVKNMYNSDVEGTQHTMQQFYFRLKKSTLATADLDGFREYLAASPMTVQYVLATPIETPLTAEEIEWFRFAHTNFPTTTVLNDAGATMELEYNADTRLWLDNIPKVTDEQAGPLVEAWMDEHFTEAEGVVYGKSAYEIAVERGFEGSEEYWLASLKGKDGKDGVDGADGAPGKDGADGAPGKDGKDGVDGKDGKDGVDGAPGADGAAGADGYTPVKGTDYYTEAEKEELINDTAENVVDTLKSGGSITIDDYVIEQGHDVYYGGAVEWYWRKWASGVAEIWGTVKPRDIHDEWIDLPIIIWAGEGLGLDLPIPVVTYSVGKVALGFFSQTFDPTSFEFSTEEDDEGLFIRIVKTMWPTPSIVIYSEPDESGTIERLDLNYTVDVHMIGRWKPLE